MNKSGDLVGGSSESEKLEALRTAIREGLESGPAELWDPDEIKRAARAGRAARNHGASDV